ncbi:MAG: radical SAM protein [Candidatus Omnitrophica bacterium]|nr:radical SAM protein [Candidatus Omnitrophota bacterium]
MNFYAKSGSIINKLVRREIDYHLLNPRHLLLFLTYRCTSRCNTCVMWQRKTEQVELSLDDWCKFIDMVAGRGIKSVELFGGDALLRKDVVAHLTAYIKKKGIPQVEVTTNCNLLDQEMAADLINAGADVFYTSLDGVGDLHDRVRGVPGSFANVQRGISALVKARKKRGSPKIIANCTISNLNIDGFEKVVDFAKENSVDTVAFEYVGEFPEESLGHSAINGVDPEPYYIAQKSSLFLNYEQATLLKSKLKAIKEKYRDNGLEIITSNIDILKIENLTQGVFPDKKCYVCRLYAIVDPFGNLIPCPFFNQYHLGNIRETHFDYLWNNEKHKGFIRHRDNKEAMICKHCILNVERNPGFFQAVRKSYLNLSGKGLDEK